MSPVTLVIDTSTPRTFVGCMHEGHWKSQTSATTHALEGLFSSVEQCLKQSGVQLQDLSGITYCSGPGSTLGLRVVMMALKTWHKLYPTLRLQTYISLEYACFHLPAGSIVVSKTGQSGWYVCQHFETGKIGPIELSVHLNHLPKDASVFELPHLKHGLGSGTRYPMCSYPLEKLPETFQAFPEILKDSSAIEPFSLVETTYATWNEQRHR